MSLIVLLRSAPEDLPEVLASLGTASGLLSLAYPEDAVGWDAATRWADDASFQAWRDALPNPPQTACFREAGGAPTRLEMELMAQLNSLMVVHREQGRRLAALLTAAPVLVVCARCYRVRGSDGRWTAGAGSLSHALCPECDHEP